MDIRRLDVSNPDQLRSWYDTVNAAIRVDRPEFVQQPFDEYVKRVTDPEPGFDRFDLVALDTHGAVAGTCMGWMSTEDNLGSAWVIAHVHPDHRRRGIGTALVAATEASLDASRTELVSAPQVPPGRVPDHHYRRFAESLGYSVTAVASVRELTWPVERALLDALAPEDPHGYRVESYVDGVPESHRPSLGVLKGLVDVDAPSGDITWEASLVTPDHYAIELRRHLEVGRRLVESVAIDGSGDVVAYSELVVPSQPGRFVSQEGTLVLDAHRGHRLGLAVKVANLRTLLDLGVTNPVIRTGNDDTNTHMVAINEQLGFVPVQATLTVLKRRPAA